MKITYSWIKEYLKIRTAPQALADRLSMAGLSVASFERIGDDWLYDIEVTSNRPDWLSVRGIVREVAAVTGAKFKPCFFVKPEKNISSGQKGLFDIVVGDKKGCPLYCAGLVKDVKVGDSPDWLKRKLESVGLRPVNNIVDITNYLMLEHGQPLHAFDFDKVGGSKVVVRRAGQDEEIVLLDGSRKKLSDGVLVIAGARYPIAAAGVMGGRDSQVGSGTVNVLLESAYFDPCLVRGGSRFLSLSSDSSYRFERGVDIQEVSASLSRACLMLRDICKGTIVSVKKAGPFSAKKPAPLKRIPVSLKKTADILGINISGSKAKRILEDLGFAVKAKSKDLFEAVAPSFRQDVAIAEDIAEEIARVYGYGRIPVTQMPVRPCCVPVSKRAQVKEYLEQLLLNIGFKEVVTYSLLGGDDYKRSSLCIPEDILSLQNPLSQDSRFLRTTLIPGLLKCTAYNINYGNKNLEIFEAARVFKGKEENLSLCLVMAGGRRTSWRSDARGYDLFDIKGALETITREFCVSDVIVEPATDSYIFESGMGFWMKAQDKVIACFGMVSREVKKAWDIKIKDDIFIAEADVEALSALGVIEKVFKPFVSMPAMIRDLSLVVPDGVSFDNITRLIFSAGCGYVHDVVMVETYQGKEIPAQARGLTMSIEYRCLEKTLTEAEINPLHAQIIGCLKKDYAVVLR